MSFRISISHCLIVVTVLGGAATGVFAGSVEIPDADKPRIAPRGIEIVEFGWGMPSAALVLERMEQMEQRPFDGVVFKPIEGDFHPGASGAPHMFDDRRWSEEHVGMADMKRLNFAGSKLPASFLTLEATRPDPEMPDPAGWLSDERWEVIESNMRLYAQARAASGARGFWIDEESYVADPWTYSEKLYPGRSFDEVYAAVRKRGAAFIDALESAGGPIVIMPIFGLCATHIDFSQDSLMPAFYDGVLDAIDPTTTIVDGNENGYYQQTNDEIQLFRIAQLEAHVRLDPENQDTYVKQRGTAQALYTDILADPESFEAFFFTQRVSCFVKPEDRPAFVEWITYNHARMAEDYIWFWTEQYDWWRESDQRDDTRAKADVPAWFAEALMSAKQRIREGNPPEPIDNIIQGAVERRDAFVAAHRADQ